MGEMADYFLSQEIDRIIFDDRPSHKPLLTWTTLDGKTLRFVDMEDTHLLNCIHLSERRERYRGEEFLNNAPTYRGMVQELIKRKKLKYSYFDLTIDERLRVRI
ncbi:hypothetical protein ACH6EH_07010 [Paenibacillus sp. JSM ZJ436]|uniref:hypothetical protein n=1 Tax=Paenibacillus sp. JSM ZJ436 TaxID=3376190 RepID=UPI0037995794